MGRPACSRPGAQSSAWPWGGRDPVGTPTRVLESSTTPRDPRLSAVPGELPRERLELGHGFAGPSQGLPYLSVPALPSQGPAQAAPGCGRRWAPSLWQTVAMGASPVSCCPVWSLSGRHPSAESPRGPLRQGRADPDSGAPPVGQDRPPWPAAQLMSESRRDRPVNTRLCCPTSLRLRPLPSVCEPRAPKTSAPPLGLETDKAALVAFWSMVGAAHRAASSWSRNCVHVCIRVCSCPVCTPQVGSMWVCVPCVYICMCETTPACMCMCPACPRRMCAHHRAINVGLWEACPCCPIPGPGAIRLWESVFASRGQWSGCGFLVHTVKVGAVGAMVGFRAVAGTQTHLESSISPASQTAGSADPKLIYLLMDPQSWVHWPAFVLKRSLFLDVR